jgi:membrane protein YdbS with pleckstrin-like domain
MCASHHRHQEVNLWRWNREAKLMVLAEILAMIQFWCALDSRISAWIWPAVITLAFIYIWTIGYMVRAVRQRRRWGL